MYYMSAIRDEIFLFDASTKQTKVFNRFGDFLRDDCFLDTGIATPVVAISVLDAGNNHSDIFYDGRHRQSNKSFLTVVRTISSRKPPIEGTLLRIRHSNKSGTFSQVIMLYPTSQLARPSRGDIDVWLGEVTTAWASC